MLHVAESTRLILIGTLLLMGIGLLAERLSPLRRPILKKAPRVTDNLGQALIAGALVRILALPSLFSLSVWVSDQNCGLLNWLHVSGAIRILLGILALDYTHYHWHRLNHRWSLLWRFHLVHHSDRDMDVSTTVRRHFGEPLIWALFNAAQIVLFGVDPRLWILSLGVTIAASQFHHLNARIPASLEKALGSVLVTRGMHELHHSVVEKESQSNFSVVFPWWDRLHHSRIHRSAQSLLVIGAPGARDFGKASWFRSLLLPFRRQG